MLKFLRFQSESHCPPKLNEITFKACHELSTMGRFPSSLIPTICTLLCMGTPSNLRNALPLVLSEQTLLVSPPEITSVVVCENKWFTQYSTLSSVLDCASRLVCAVSSSACKVFSV